MSTYSFACDARCCARLNWCAFDWNQKAIGFYKSAVGARELGSTFCRAESLASPASANRAGAISGEEVKGHRLINFGLNAEEIARLAAQEDRPERQRSSAVQRKCKCVRVAATH